MLMLSSTLSQIFNINYNVIFPKQIRFNFPTGPFLATRSCSCFNLHTKEMETVKLHSIDKNLSPKCIFTYNEFYRKVSTHPSWAQLPFKRVQKHKLQKCKNINCKILLCTKKDIVFNINFKPILFYIRIISVPSTN